MERATSFGRPNENIFGGLRVGTTRREFGVERTTNTHVLGKGRPGEKVGVERTTRTEYVLIINLRLPVLRIGPQPKKYSCTAS